MSGIAKLMGAMAGLSLLAGCAASVPEARVTRFHLGQPIARAAILIEPRDPAQRSSLEFTTDLTAMNRALTGAGFTVTTDPQRAELTAQVEVTRESRDLGPSSSGLSIGLGGGTYGSGVGVGGGVTLPIGKRNRVEGIRTELFVQIKRRGAQDVMWEGRAHLEARSGTPYASPAAAVDRLATALFKDFPGESGRTITVK